MENSGFGVDKGLTLWRLDPLPPKVPALWIVNTDYLTAWYRVVNLNKMTGHVHDACIDSRLLQYV